MNKFLQFLTPWHDPKKAEKKAEETDMKAKETERTVQEAKATVAKTKSIVEQYRLASVIIARERADQPRKQ